MPAPGQPLAEGPQRPAKKEKTEEQRIIAAMSRLSLKTMDYQEYLSNLQKRAQLERELMRIRCAGPRMGTASLLPGLLVRVACFSIHSCVRLGPERLSTRRT